MESVSVILPTYNERENITVLLPEIERAFADIPLEILVVDDGSPDGTAAAARAINARFQNIRVIARGKKEGIGAALRHGFDEARHAVLISSDSDMSFCAGDMRRLYDKVLEGHDVVVGSRHSVGARYDHARPATRVKYQISYYGNRLVRWLTRVGVNDFSANFRAIRRDVWGRLEIEEKTNAVLLEMVVKAAYSGARIAEIPVAFAERLHGTSKLNLWAEAPRCLLKAAKYFWWYRIAGRAVRQRPAGLRD
jgi:dolichol-phosphate mannosyltransferase